VKILAQASMEGIERTRLTAGGSYYVAPNVQHGIVT